MVKAKNNLLPENLSTRRFLLWNDVKIIEFRKIFQIVDFSIFDPFSLKEIFR
jgi:hypothetical protein